MSRKCSVLNCQGNYDEKNKKIVYGFPSDPQEAKIWLNALPNKIEKVTQFMGVCKDHWPETAFFQKNGIYEIPLQPPSLFADVTDSRCQQTVPDILNCCIPSCERNNYSQDNRQVYPFPSDISQRQAWISAIPIKIKCLTESSGLCSKHWSPDSTKELQNGVTRPTCPPNIFPNTVSAACSGVSEASSVSNVRTMYSNLVTPKTEPSVNEESFSCVEADSHLLPTSSASNTINEQSSAPCYTEPPNFTEQTDISESIPIMSRSNPYLLNLQLQRLKFALPELGEETNLETIHNFLRDYASSSLEKCGQIDTDIEKHNRLIDCYRKLCDLERHLTCFQRNYNI